MSKQYIILFVILLAAGLGACRPYTPTPKKKGYFRLDLPTEHSYQKFTDSNFPFEFEYPNYAKITQDTNLVAEEDAPYWINISFIDYNATIYLSYKPLTIQDNIQKLVDESYRLSYGHDRRADYIATNEFTTPHNLYGMNYQVGGDAASAHQFYITDSTKNFVRGSLYFETVPNADSLKPAIDFLNIDMQHLINTMKFK